MKTVQEILLEKLESRTAKIAILGMGYVGLPLAVVFAEAGFEVIGIDPDVRKVNTLNAKESYIGDVPTGVVARLVGEGLLSATTDFSVISQADAVSICVPTPLRKTGDPDLSYILNATADIKKFLHPGMAVVLESTTYPGTTRELLLQELTEGTDLEAGVNLFLAFSPEIY